MLIDAKAVGNITKQLINTHYITTVFEIKDEVRVKVEGQTYIVDLSLEEMKSAMGYGQKRGV